MAEDRPPEDSPPNGLGDRIADRYRYRPMGQAYQGALEAVFSIVIATAAGFYADRYFETSPWCLVAGATIGFAAFVLRLSRLGAALEQAPDSRDPGPTPSETDESPGGAERAGSTDRAGDGGDNGAR